jgi:hypothetical protein
MALAEDLIEAVRAAGGVIRRDGDMIELTAPLPLPADLVARIREAKSALLSRLTESSDWRARHSEALAYWGTLHPAEEASQIAWSELLGAWHKRHGRRWPAWQCAGCDQAIGGLAALTVADGNRVHLDKFDCLLSFGGRWRRNATAGLQALGLEPPAERLHTSRPDT